MKTVWIASLVAAAALGSGCSHMKSMKAPGYATMLAAPAGITSSGTGMGSFDFDEATMVLNYRVEHMGLTGPATAAHIHGPAAPGANAGVVVPFAAAASPIVGTATLTAAQAADMKAGKWYVNVHTAANPGGEVRGQIMLKP